MNKEFIKTEHIQKNGILLAEQIFNNGFIPSIIYVSLRGGALLGNIVSEYFKLSCPPTLPPLYAAVVAHSYTGPRNAEKIIIEGWTYSPKKIRRSDKIILIDDIFDSGRTINELSNILIENGAIKENLKIVVHDYKIRTYETSNLEHFPDYWARKLVIDDPSRDNWIHYLSHEIDGLTTEEIKENYDEDLHSTLNTLIHRKQER